MSLTTSPAAGVGKQCFYTKIEIILHRNILPYKQSDPKVNGNTYNM